MEGEMPTADEVSEEFSRRQQYVVAAIEEDR